MLKYGFAVLELIFSEKNLTTKCNENTKKEENNLDVLYVDAVVRFSICQPHCQTQDIQTHCSVILEMLHVHISRYSCSSTQVPVMSPGEGIVLAHPE